MTNTSCPQHLCGTLMRLDDAGRGTIPQDSCCAYIGPSMYPTLTEQDLLEITPYTQTKPRKGDVIFFTPPGSHLPVIHRITGLDNNGFLTRGDNGSNTDPWRIAGKDMTGRVSAAYRGRVRRTIAGGLPGRFTAAYCHVRMHLMPKLRSCLKPVYSFLQHVAAHTPLAPSAGTIRIVRFHNKTQPQYKLMRGNTVIGNYDSKTRQWLLKKRYRMFVKKSSLPGTPS